MCCSNLNMSHNDRESMGDHWTSIEDAIDDFLSVSDFLDKEDIQPPSKPNEHVLKARTKASLYDDPVDLERENYCPPIRGYPIKTNFKLLPPGGTPSFLQQQYETAQQIRQVSGMGYSNDLIEHSLRGGNTKKLDCMPEIELNHSSNSSSGSSTPARSPQTVCSKASASSSSDGETKNEKKIGTNVVGTTPTSGNANPTRSIYDILKGKKEELQNPTNYRNIFQQTEKPLDIYSKREFPDLT